MYRHLDDFHELPDDEGKIVRRNRRKERAIELAWDYFLTRGDKGNGYRLALKPLARSIKVGVSADTVAVYLRESASWDPLDPFEEEWVNIAGSPRLFLKPKPGRELRARLQRKGKGGGNG